MVSAKAATLILRGVIATGESPMTSMAERSEKQQPARDLHQITSAPSTTQGTPEMPAIMAMMKERETNAAKSRRKGAVVRSRVDDELAYPPSKRLKKNQTAPAKGT